MERPELNASITEESLRSYYYLKEELSEFSERLGLGKTGSKDDLVDRIAHYLNTGEKSEPRSKRKNKRSAPMTPDDIIEENVTFSELHRGFFKEHIEGFRFNVRFCSWLRENPGKRYSEAIEKYPDTLKKGGEPIGKQFRYNTYIRDFFADNPEMSLIYAVRCWNGKKMTSDQTYCRDDLKYLERPSGEDQ